MTKGCSDSPAISCRNISHTFGEVVALADVSVDFPAGGIHAVVGQNGAGKTTFARVVAGIVRPDSGMLSINGRKLEPGSVASARSSGVELVHQSFALPPSFTVAEAMEFGSGGGIGFFSRKELVRRGREHLEALDMDIDPRRRIRDLPIELQQAVEIARALSSNARILILDEPTAVLPPPGIENLFLRIRNLRDTGVTIILILHKTREVWAVADTITVLRNGKLVAGPLRSDETDPGQMASMIMGTARHGIESGATAMSAANRPDLSGRTGQDSGGVSAPASEPALELKGICTTERTDEARLDSVSLSVQRGEVVGIAGVEGNGQVTLMRTLAGLVDVSDGGIHINGQEVNDLGLAQRRSLGLRIIPFDRNSEGLSLTSALWENWAAGQLAAGPLLGLINPASIRERCTASMSDWDVRYNSPKQNAASLSGGNCQKLILSRELDDGAGMIVAAQPTRGLDIGATAFVWSTLRKARSRGCGILLVSSDLDELFEISDRILVMFSGRIVCDLRPPYDLATAGHAMVGAAA